MNTLPNSIKYVVARAKRTRPPHPRKKLELTCLIYGTNIKVIAEELEELARTLREDGKLQIGTVGHGFGHYMTMVHSLTKRS